MAMAGDSPPDFGFPYWAPLPRSFPPDSPFFSSGNVERELLAKQVALDLTEDERHQLQMIVENESRRISCPIVGCGERLSSLENFEAHYHARHAASCSVCTRVYPTSRLLSIHVSETHDSFFQAKVDRGYAMYECLVEGCGMKFKNYKARHQHLVDKHKFPTTFEFLKKARPSKKRRERLQSRHRSKLKQDEGEEGTCSQSMEVEARVDIEGLVSAVSRLATSDTNISFGRRHGRGLPFVPRSIRRESGPKTPEAPGAT
ncbi:PREDICTED: zinc finger protein 511 [Tarenaya hassleriana]|uniref:zinc finger protein 511 n=1 Tax=Tarenaya hassleriana TaxID=28532 RepID=UPI00053C1291|nr:PREDICTED: zinc finger protein 511 [Tarenaya hassleriana]